MPHSEFDSLLSRAWEASRPAYARMRDEGAESVLTADPLLSECCASDGCVCCIDEGVKGSLHSPGSLLLMHLQGDGDGVRKFIDMSGATGVYSHRGCGAAGLAYGKYPDQVLSGESVDAFAERMTARLAEEYGLEYKGMITELHRPDSLHDARVIYYCAAPVAFDPKRSKTLPKGFVVHRAFVTPRQGMNDLALAAAIAMGGHGFAEKFTEEEPLLVVGLAGDDGLASLEGEMREALAEYGARVTFGLAWLPVDSAR